MKKILAQIIIFFSLFNCGIGQSWGEAEDCHVNVNNPDYQNLPIRQGTISSTVKIRFSDGGECSGTLINRNTSDGDVGFYLLSARHCVNDIDFGANHTLCFNYQSPDADNESTPPTNRGERNRQSGEILFAGTTITDTIDDGFEYLHNTQLRLVSWFIWGDITLLEILTPIPPHFNLTYAGWNPSRFGTGISTDHLPTDFYGVHHPRGDIKKISGTNGIVWLETPIATGCYTITTVIDVLFGWIWGNSVSTSVICNYVDNPWMTVPDWQYGISENGSSGSGFFDSNNSLIGVLSGSLSTCDFKSTTTYGKLHANYSNAKIKNTLNPSHNVWVDLYGMTERKITRYTDLELPGEEGVSGHYFPANHYQSENRISLVADNTVTTTQPITIYNGADYEFVAGESIELGPGFTAEVGSNFTARIGSSGSLKSASSTLEQSIIGQLQSIDLPEYKKFEIEKYLHSDTDNNAFEISELYPNPNNGDFEFTVSNNNQSRKNIFVEILDVQGKKYYTKPFIIENEHTVSINRSDLPKGFYILKISNGEYVTNKKLVVK
jgi:hypothetical protein